MKQLCLFIAFLSFANYSIGQVGINTTAPNAQLEIKSSNQATPANTDGILIPKIDAFPAINPTGAQDGMMVYLTTTVGVNPAGFYYWKNSINSWKSVTGISLENDPEVSSASANKIPKYNGTTLVDGIIFDNGTNIGVGTTNPQSKMEIVGADNPLELKLSSTSGFGASRLSFISDKDTNNEWRPAYIESGDNATGAFWGRLDFYTNGNGAGNKFGSTRAMSVANGNLGIGYPNPSDKLEVNGKTKTTNLQITTGATANYVLQSDAAGNGSWVNPTTLTITETDPQVSSATANIIPKYNGTTLVDGVMVDNGTNVGVGITPTAGNKLEVAGKTKTDSLQMTIGATANYVLQSDAAGNATWVNPNSINSKWDLNGNSGTSTSNYIGTSDDTSLQFKVNSVKSGIIGNTTNNNTAFGFHACEFSGVNQENTAFGNNALNINTNGISNTSIGYKSLFKNNGNKNTAIGGNALYFNEIGENNTAVGNESLNKNKTGNQNIAIGTSTLFNAVNSDGNVGIGFESLKNLTSGGGNVAVGYNAGTNQISGSENIIIGNNAEVANTSNSSQLSIGNTIYGANLGQTNAKIGIGTNAPTERLEVVGRIKSSSIQLTLGAFADGILSSDINGVTSWISPTSLPNTSKAWFKENTVQPVISITDNMFHTGNVAIGKNVAEFPFEVQNTGYNISSKINSTFNGTNINGFYGTQNFINTTTGNDTFGTFSKIENSGTGNSTNNLNFLQGTSTGNQTVVSNFISNTKDGNHTGVKNSISSSGNGVHFSFYSALSGAGNGDKYGIFQEIFTTGNGNQYGNYTNMNGNGSGLHFGNHTIISHGSGERRGSSTEISGIGDGLHYGTYNLITSSGVGNKFGAYNKVSSIGGNNYGLYSEAAGGSTNFAGFFVGDVSIGATATNRYKLPNNKGTANSILVSDGAGNSSWIDPIFLNFNESDPKIQTTVQNKIATWNGSSLVSGNIYDNGTIVGIGGTPSGSSILNVFGKTTTTNLQLTTGATANFILQSDATGNATWVNPTILAIPESDPQVSSATTNKIPKYNGTTLVDGIILDNGTNVGVGTTNPSAKLEVTSAGTSEVRISSTSAFGPSRLSMYSDKDIPNEWRPAYIESADNGTFTGRLDFFTNGTGSANKLGTVLAMSAVDGKVGIGIIPSKAKLEVSGFVSNQPQSCFAFYARSGACNGTAATGVSNGSTNYSIYASDRIMASEFNAFSDKRIKNILSVSNAANDLAVLNKLKVTNYKHIDIANKGNEVKKGFIAQEVKEVFPEAVSQTKEFIPNIYQVAKSSKLQGSNLTITLEKNHDLKIGDKVRLIAEKEQSYTVINTTENSFEVADYNQSIQSIFVFGKEVNDFNVVDYDRIFTLGISAIQELSKENEAQKTEIESLKKELKNMNIEILKRLERLEKK